MTEKVMESKTLAKVMESKPVEAVGLGDIEMIGNSHPVHPALVHYPVAFLSAAYALDCVYGLATSSRTASTLNRIYNLTPHLKEISRISHFTNIAGILTALPAAATGSVELWHMIKANGIYERIERKSDGEVVYEGMNPKTRHGVPHGLLNEVALGVSLYNWWSRRKRVDYLPKRANILLSAITLPGLAFSAYLGGAMVYKYGVGVMRMGEAKTIKEDIKRDSVKKWEGWTVVKERDQ